MKIIASLPNEHLLVDMSRSEFEIIIFNDASITNSKINELITDKTNLDASHIYRKHKLIVELQNDPDYAKARNKLESMLKALTPIENLINKIDTKQ